MGDLLNSEIFIDCYNELDHYFRKILQVEMTVSHSVLLRKMKRINYTCKKVYEELRSYAKLRNVIVHNVHDVHGRAIAEPNDEIVARYKKIRESIINPPLAYNNLAVDARRMYRVSKHESIIKVIGMMEESNYTFIPIIEDNVLIGIFSERTIFSYILEHKEIVLNENVSISRFMPYTNLDNYKDEDFRFVPRDIDVFEVKSLFSKNKTGKRIPIVFITEHGKYSEKILGMITPWDVAKYDYSVY